MSRISDRAARSHDFVGWAAEEARRYLTPLGDRWLHTLAVVARAVEISDAVEVDDRPVLVAAAHLHDIGYAPALVATGLHALDGGLWLRGRGEERLAGLVAHHSGAKFAAEALGLGKLMRSFDDEMSAVTDALAYCDLTTGPDGQRLTLGERLAEVEVRYGDSHAVVDALRRGTDHLSAMVERTERRLGLRPSGVAQSE